MRAVLACSASAGWTTDTKSGRRRAASPACLPIICEPVGSTRSPIASARFAMSSTRSGQGASCSAATTRRIWASPIRRASSIVREPHAAEKAMILSGNAVEMLGLKAKAPAGRAPEGRRPRRPGARDAHPPARLWYSSATDAPALVGARLDHVHQRKAPSTRLMFARAGLYLIFNIRYRLCRTGGLDEGEGRSAREENT